MAQSLDVLSRREQFCSADESLQLLSNYLRHRYGQLERSQTPPAALVGRMTDLEFRILDACMKFTEACGEIVAECKKAEQVPDEVLSDMLEEVMDYCQTLQLFSQQRKDNVTAIVEMEKQNLEEFRRLHQSVENRANVETALTAVGTAGAAVAAAAAGPVSLVAVALLSLAAGTSIRTRRDAANRVQQSLVESMQAKNVPVQCMETFAKNLDDAIERIAEDGSKISGRSARIKRRMEMILEEIQGVQTLLIAEQSLARAAVSLKGYMGGVGGGLESLIGRLREMPDSLLKMDLQNVIYRYFAESARLFKQIQHSIRSGEAELSVIRDGEEPAAEDLTAAFVDFMEAVNSFGSWRSKGRLDVEEKLKRALRSNRRLSTLPWKLSATACVCLLACSAASLGGASVYRLPLLWIVGTAVGSALAAVMFCCLRRRQDVRQLGGLKTLWEKMGVLESNVDELLRSWTPDLHMLSFPKALESAQRIRCQLDHFMQQLQMKALIFDPSVPNAS
ncbi:unnamed protein product [Symbiodinium sp. CCMP2592]|nr:unnamed protein product [Symbiodinium sp. CCMP2592]